MASFLLAASEWYFFCHFYITVQLICLPMVCSKWNIRQFKSIGTISVVWMLAKKFGMLNQRELKSQPDSAPALKWRYNWAGSCSDLMESSHLREATPAWVFHLHPNNGSVLLRPPSWLYDIFYYLAHLTHRHLSSRICIPFLTVVRMCREFRFLLNRQQFNHMWKKGRLRTADKISAVTIWYVSKVSIRKEKFFTIFPASHFFRKPLTQAWVK